MEVMKTKGLNNIEPTEENTSGVWDAIHMS